MRHVRLLVTAGTAVAVAVSILPANAYTRPGTTELASVAPGGRQFTETTSLSPSPIGWEPSISGDGRYVAFTSWGQDLRSGAVSGTSNVWIHDRGTGASTLVSVGMDNTPGVGVDPSGPTTSSDDPSVSGDGRHVAFESFAANLVPGDTNSAPDVFVRDLRTGRTVRVSLSSNGAQANTPPTQADNLSAPSISADGRYVAFSSSATNLVPDDTNGEPDVFVHDMQTGKTVRVSVASDGQQGNGYSEAPSISANGRFVVFTSNATNLVAGSVSPFSINVFLHDMKTGKTELISKAPGGGAAQTGPLDYFTAYSTTFAGREISDSGRYVAFISNADNLVPNDANADPEYWADGIDNGMDVFVADRQTGRIERVSVTSSGEQRSGPQAFSFLSISADGRYVAFGSTQLLTPDEVNQDSPGEYGTTGFSNNGQIFVHDLITGATELVSRNSSGDQATGCQNLGSQAQWASISSSGRYVAFQACATNLPHNRNNPAGTYYVYVRDRGIDLGVGGFGGSLPNQGPGQSGTCVQGVCVPPVCVSTVCIPPGGALVSQARGNAPDAVWTAQGADLIGATIAYRPQFADLFVREEVETMPSIAGGPPSAAVAILYGLNFTVRGVHYEVRVQRTPGRSDDPAGGASFGLFRQDPTTGVYLQAATLQGGYGTTGDEVVFSMPLRNIGLQNGGHLVGARAFTAVGTFVLGAVRELDELRLG